ncbi:MAG TPA: head GIN domain-containing protein [Pyrinomonadaceae bacterium]
MKKTLFFLVLVLACGGCRWGGMGAHTTGSGVMKVDKRNVPAFAALEVSGAYDVEIVCGKEQSLEVEGDDNLLPLITTDVSDGVLRIGNKSGGFSTKNKLRVRISAPEFEAVSTSGASDINISNIKSDAFNIETSGAGNVHATGEVKTLEVKMSGAGEVNARDLRAGKVTVHSSGAASADVYASEELRAEVSGAGHVNYYGDPKVFSEDRSGAATITKK